jgi:hypothetical protein
LSGQLENENYQFKMLERELEQQKRHIKFQEMEITNLEEQLSSRKVEIYNKEHEWKLMQESSEVAENYINALELHVETLENYLKNQKIQLTTSECQRLSNELLIGGLHKINRVSKKKIIKQRKDDVGTITNLFGTKADVNIIPVALPAIYKGIQASPALVDIGIQVNLQEKQIILIPKKEQKLSSHIKIVNLTIVAPESFEEKLEKKLKEKLEEKLKEEEIILRNHILAEEERRKKALENSQEKSIMTEISLSKKRDYLTNQSMDFGDSPMNFLNGGYSKDNRKVCPMCNHPRNKLKRPIYKIAPYNIQGLEHLFESKNKSKPKYNRSTQTEECINIQINTENPSIANSRVETRNITPKKLVSCKSERKIKKKKRLQEINQTIMEDRVTLFEKLVKNKSACPKIQVVNIWSDFPEVSQYLKSRPSTRLSPLRNMEFKHKKKVKDKHFRSFVLLPKPDDKK